MSNLDVQSWEFKVGSSILGIQSRESKLGVPSQTCEMKAGHSQPGSGIHKSKFNVANSQLRDQSWHFKVPSSKLRFLASSKLGLKVAISRSVLRCPVNIWRTCRQTFHHVTSPPLDDELPKILSNMCGAQPTASPWHALSSKLR